ncbi:MAG TPA: phosphotransferase [Ilumatobacter sp.]|nr:phosphotransferase [Ilumatobacter sp.]
MTRGAASTPGALIAQGRSAEIFECGDGKVLRRLRGERRVPVHEPIVMRAVRAAGYPVPELFDVDGSDMVMERVAGVDMVKDIERRPWRARRYGAMLADLHQRLREIPVDRGVLEGDQVPAAYGTAEVYVHGDLHPMNVILTDHGPVVIDWEGSRIGPRDADAAITWMLLEIGELDDVPRWLRPIVGLVRSQLLRAFLAGVPKPSAETIRAACEFRLNRDPNMRPVEMERIREFMAVHG